MPPTPKRLQCGHPIANVHANVNSDRRSPTQTPTVWPPDRRYRSPPTNFIMPADFIAECSLGLTLNAFATQRSSSAVHVAISSSQTASAPNLFLSPLPRLHITLPTTLPPSSPLSPHTCHRTSESIGLEAHHFLLQLTRAQSICRWPLPSLAAVHSLASCHYCVDRHHTMDGQLVPEYLCRTTILLH